MALPLLPLLLLSLILYTLIRIRTVGLRPSSLPPGPPTRWLLGNLLQMPKEKAYLQFKKWADEYGPIYTLILGTQTTIVLNDAEVVKELLDKRSGIYSSRAEAYLSRVASKGLRMAGWVCFLPFLCFLSPPLSPHPLRSPSTRGTQTKTDTETKSSTATNGAAPAKSCTPS